MNALIRSRDLVPVLALAACTLTTAAHACPSTAPGHINTMSYSEVPGYDRTECVKDNVRGLIWESKVNQSGHLRHFENTYLYQLRRWPRR